MQNKLFRGLFISLLALTLSACVGSVTLPAGTIAEANAQNTGETLDRKSIVIDDKEPELQDKKVVETVEPKPIISVEPKPISANPCIANPFGDTCGGEEFNDAREAVCLTERESHRCRVIIPLVCESDSLDVLCAGDETYYAAQKTACADTPNSDRCELTTIRICGADILNPYCSEAETYFVAQEILCADAAPYSEHLRRCWETIKRVCDVDVLDTLCIKNRPLYITSSQNGTGCFATGTFFTRTRRLRCTSLADKLASHYSEEKIACTSEIDSERCAPIIVRVCSADSLDTLCNGLATYYPAQKIACADEPNSERCAPTIARVCGLDSLDSLCKEQVIFYPAQESACTSEPNSPRCDITIRRVCKTTPFNTVCQSKNLTHLDLPVLPNSYFRHDVGDSSGVVNSFGYSCGNFRYCSVTFSSIINIKPLNDTNTGTATYAGSVSLNARNKRSGYPEYNHININNNIDIIVDFDNNTLTYSGNLDSSSNPFNINGNFTDRGLITGSVDFRSNEASLIGLIGQDEAIGVFTNGYNEDKTKPFAGGFIATRE